MKTLLSALASLGLALDAGFAADWPCWRGPDGLGVSLDTGFPESWSKEGVAWRAEIPGKGASSPIVYGDRVYVTAQTSDQGLHVIALKRDSGAVLWDKEVARGSVHANNLHNMATPTAVTDGRHVWALFGTGHFFCLDLDGAEVWHRNLSADYLPYHANHGYGSSPMLLNGRLYVPYMHQGPSFLLAVDAATGKTVWKKDRDFAAREEAKDSYSSPIFIHENDRTDLVVQGAEALTAYDPGSGDERWMVKGMDVPHPYGRTVAGVAAGDGLVIAVASGFQNRGYTIGVKTGGTGDVTSTHKAWTLTKFSPDCPSPLVYNGLVFTLRDDGMASCLDLKTGEAHWQERLFSDNVKVSPVGAEGRVYFTSGQGNTVVVKASSKFEVISKNAWNDETLSSLALSDGRIYLRSASGLVCIAKR
jgi:outer membrane protein assembly factor BamB